MQAHEKQFIVLFFLFHGGYREGTSEDYLAVLDQTPRPERPEEETSAGATPVGPMDPDMKGHIFPKAEINKHLRNHPGETDAWKE